MSLSAFDVKATKWIPSLGRVKQELTVSVESFLDAAVVSDVLALGGDAVEMEANLGVDKVSVLLDHALGLRLVVGFGVRVPPVLQVALKIKNVSLKFWSYTSSL